MATTFSGSLLLNILGTDMYKKIVVALGLSHGHGNTALDVARRLKTGDSNVVALHVIEPVSGFASYYLPPNHEAEARKAVSAAIADRVGDAKDFTVEILSGHPGRMITEYAESMGADCIIVGSHKPELQDYLLGSTAARVVRHAACSVHVLR